MLSFNLSLTHLNRKGEELTNRGGKRHQTHTALISETLIDKSTGISFLIL